ncbi:uncharacterized protein LOC129921461 [Episyrphus balteatus]|uniref:uncharacterized protein LOC129921461 n=1 Tax=Episyrphus balteatus TaxID=286459 RepID=UPI002485A6A4|nr:uncharacterized protein LOC129921461 [Episyrphus balteatus]
MITSSLKFTSTVGLLFLAVSFASANSPLSCITCEGIGCLRTSLTKKETCIDPLDICVTVFDGFQVVRKGCSLSVPIELRKKCNTPNGIECHKCNQDNCNTWGRDDYRCVECDSSRNADCKNNPSAIAPTRCASPTSPNSYCYARIESSKTTRGCSLSVKDQQECFKSANCMLCLAGDVKACNAVNFTPGSARAFLI